MSVGELTNKSPLRCVNSQGHDPRSRPLSTEQDIPYGHCHCGCGQTTSLAKADRPEYGHVKGRPVRFKVGHGGAKTLAEKLASHTGPPDKNGCWPWTGWLGKGTPYGVLTHRQKARTAHRWAWINRHGSIPEGFQIHHTCENPACVNPDHLEAVSVSEHVERHLSDRCRKGHKFTPENTYINSKGHRYCRACRRQHAADLRKRRGISGPRSCENCGQVFKPTRTHRKFCSDDCVKSGYADRGYSESTLPRGL